MSETDYHKKFRELIEHEDKLIADRNTWFVLSQSFLFISFALTLSALSKEGLAAKTAVLASQFHSAIVLIGVALSIVTFVSVWAASHAIKNVSATWLETDTEPDRQKILDEEGIDQKDQVTPYQLEKMRLTGGGSKRAERLGYFAAFGFSTVFFAFWVCVGFQLWYPHNAMQPAEMTSQE
ncbi:MAG: hypothetical protein AAF922_07330 [Pseudomonadota bacterium]